MSTNDLDVTFIGGPLHGQHQRLPAGTVHHQHDGVKYEISPADADDEGHVEKGKTNVHFVAVTPNDAPDGVDLLRDAIASVGRHDAK